MQCGQRSLSSTPSLPPASSSNFWGNQLRPCRSNLVVDRINRLFPRPTFCTNVSPIGSHNKRTGGYLPNKRRHHMGGSNGFEPLCSGGYTSLKK